MNPIFLIQKGELPGNRKRKSEAEKVEEFETKKSERQTQWARREQLVKLLDWDTMDNEFPGFRWTAACRNMTMELNKQANINETKPLEVLDNYLIWGGSGTGKSSSINLLYPDCYKKQKGTQFWDGYDRMNPNHSVVWIDEMSKETLKCMTGKADGGFEFLKELADRYAVTVDEKYTKGYKIRPKKIFITMNEHPFSLLPDRAVEINKAALVRKFRILHIEDWLDLNGLKVTDKGAAYKTHDEITRELEYELSSEGESDYEPTKRSCGPEKGGGEECERDQRVQDEAEEFVQGLLWSEREIEQILGEEPGERFIFSNDDLN